jgi:hypothetical protein
MVTLKIALMLAKKLMLMSAIKLSADVDVI